MLPNDQQAPQDEPRRRRRLAYALAAGSAVGAASEAEGIVVYSGIEDLVIQQGASQALGLNADYYPDIFVRNYVDPYVGIEGNFQGVFLQFAPGRVVGDRFNDLGYARALGPGFLVDASSVEPDTFVASLAFGDNHPNAQFNNVENAYIGFSFPDLSSGLVPIPQRTDLHYAWLRVSINNEQGSFIVHDWAYETEFNVGIETGDRGAAGDFNDDGVVDLADYTVWRDNLGTDDILGGRGDENGDSLNVVDIDDYTLWRANFGAVVNQQPPSAFVPEPGALGLLAAGSLGLTALRERREKEDAARQQRDRS
ncbi:MAG: PEP-CTERM sorting domain-containing protein [Planctomycetota bacterium]